MQYKEDLGGGGGGGPGGVAIKMTSDFAFFLQAPVSQNCPLVLHDHQKGLNKLLAAIKEVYNNDFYRIFLTCMRIITQNEIKLAKNLY